MAEDILKVERHPNYVTITLNRPEKRNSLNEALLASMDKAFASIETDKEIRAVILRGEGKSFCAGLDLAEADRLEGGHSPVSIERVFHRLEQLPVPVIAAVQGAALAGGCFGARGMDDAAGAAGVSDVGRTFVASAAGRLSRADPAPEEISGDGSCPRKGNVAIGFAGSGASVS